MATTGISMTTLLDLTRKYVNEYVSTTDDFSTETDELLKAHIQAAAKQVAAAAPENLVCVREACSTKVEERPDGMYYSITPIPDNCLKIVSIASSSWKRPVVDILPITHPNAGKEFSAVAGLGSGPFSPHVYRMGDMLYSHAGSSKNFETSSFYVAAPGYDSTNDKITNISEQAMDAIAYEAASLYLGSVGDGNAQSAAVASKACIDSWTSGDMNFVPPAVEQPQIQAPQE